MKYNTLKILLTYMKSFHEQEIIKITESNSRSSFNDCGHLKTCVHNEIDDFQHLQKDFNTYKTEEYEVKKRTGSNSLLSFVDDGHLKQ